jgi:hypothetical protein
VPKAYYQCPECKTPGSTRYKSGTGKKKKGRPRGVPVLYCCCREGRKFEMTYRGDGLVGRDNWPHGAPSDRQQSSVEVTPARGE